MNKTTYNFTNIFRCRLEPPVNCFVPLSGTVSVTPGSIMLRTTADLTTELFRNDILVIEGRSFRVGSTAASHVGSARFPGSCANAVGDEDLLSVDDSTSGSDSSVTGEISTSVEEDTTISVGNGRDSKHKKCKPNGLSADSLNNSVSNVAEQSHTRKRQRRSTPTRGDEIVDTVATSLIAVSNAKIHREATVAARSTLQRVGIGYVSVANDVIRTGGHFSAADTAPHMLRSSAAGYAEAFTPTQLPLNRAWDGPSELKGITAYRVGMPGDLRVLWREVSQRGSVQEIRGAAAIPSTSGAAASATHGLQSCAAGVNALVTALGGDIAFREAPEEFPPDHVALREAAAKVGLDLLNPVESQALGARTAARPGSKSDEKGRRRPNKQAFIVKGNTHLAPEQQKAMKLARLQVLKEQHASDAAKSNVRQ